jgi:spore coat polysaccharide biosynthesis protein SpsF
MGSTRLPGKSLLPLAGAPLLQRVIERLLRCAAIDELVIATTEKPEDDPIAALAAARGATVFRGAEHDLVDRYRQAAQASHADVVVRVPADNAAPEPGTIDDTIRFHLECGNDFTSSYPDVIANGFPDGIGAEVFSAETLERVWRESTDLRNREHPHTYVYEHPERFRIGTPECPADVRRPDIKLDVNTPTEYAYMARLYADLYPRDPRFGIHDIIAWHDRVHQAPTLGGRVR